MSDNFLYLLGAGASCKALPMVADFVDRLKSFAHDLSTFYSGPDMANSLIWGEPRERLVEATRWLAEEASHHASVDTFAKKLFFRHDNKNLKKLKAVLSTYLAVEQARKDVDYRYDAFLASVLEFDTWGRYVFLNIFTF